MVSSLANDRHLHFGIDNDRASEWTDCGRPGNALLAFSMAVHEGSLYAGACEPGATESGRVYRYIGRLGEELEVMGMLVHNGRLLAGTLPLAEVYSHEGITTWKRLTRLDHTPDVKYRRAWTMAEHDGRLYCSTLPSGKIFAFEAGRNVTWGHTLTEKWHHVAAVKSRNRLELYVDGLPVAQSSQFDSTDYNLDGVRR